MVLGGRGYRNNRFGSIREVGARSSHAGFSADSGRTDGAVGGAGIAPVRQRAAVSEVDFPSRDFR